jgi:hypothetical protein
MCGAAIVADTAMAVCLVTMSPILLVVDELGVEVEQRSSSIAGTTAPCRPSLTARSGADAGGTCSS